MNSKSMPLLQVKDLYKEFSGNAVLKGVSLQLHAGEVHAIVGGNGAGKSTIMKILTGLYKPDKGTITINGVSVFFSNPHEAHQHGIYLVPQEPLLFPNMTVSDNILIGLPGKKTLLLNKLQTIIANLGWDIDLHQRADSLSIAQQQLVEILRGLTREATILILDEPTSTLTFGEIESLFTLINQLTADGIGIFYITHRFSEIFQLSQTVSVLRDGQISKSGPIASFTYQTLIDGLLPENTYVQAIPKQDTASHSASEKDLSPALVVKNLSNDRFRNVSFTLYENEILGIAGVVGAGRTELAEAFCGLTSITNGEIFLQDIKITSTSLHSRMKKGLVYVPEDRQKHGIFPITSIRKNITSTILHLFKGLILPSKKEKQLATTFLEEVRVKSAHIEQELSELSGGNQQKVVLAKYLATHPKVIILDEPTRGIDAYAREEIYKMILTLKKQGLALILISSDMEEIVHLSDRVLIMHEGQIVKELNKQPITANQITTYAFGVSNEVIL